MPDIEDPATEPRDTLGRLAFTAFTAAIRRRTPGHPVGGMEWQGLPEDMRGAITEGAAAVVRAAVFDVRLQWSAMAMAVAMEMGDEGGTEGGGGTGNGTEGRAMGQGQGG